jgi:hypothetical protein
MIGNGRTVLEKQTEPFNVGGVRCLAALAGANPDAAMRLRLLGYHAIEHVYLINTIHLAKSLYIPAYLSVLVRQIYGRPTVPSRFHPGSTRSHTIPLTSTSDATTMANMFGALNRFISRLDANDGNPQNASSSSGAFGFQVLRNTNQNIALDPWFDFIIGINGRTIDNADPTLFTTEVRNCAGATISLGVYSAKGQAIREIYAGVPQDEGLGLQLQWSPLSLGEDVWHILDVMPNSPADVAGFLPYSDYVIGSPEGVLRGDGGLGELVEEFMNRPLRLYVYNSEYDVTRMITITPAKNWGGEGALGCVLGYGALHRIPAALTEPPQAPGETLFEAGQPAAASYNEKSSFDPYAAAGPSPPGAPTDFLVPANLPLSNPTPPPPRSGSAGPPPGKSKKARAHAPAPGLDDYFAEGEQKSKEMESGSSTPKPTGGLPPPPKGPPKAA